MPPSYVVDMAKKRPSLFWNAVRWLDAAQIIWVAISAKWGWLMAILVGIAGWYAMYLDGNIPLWLQVPLSIVVVVLIATLLNAFQRYVRQPPQAPYRRLGEKGRVIAGAVEAINGLVGSFDDIVTRSDVKQWGEECIRVLSLRLTDTNSTEWMTIQRKLKDIGEASKVPMDDVRQRAKEIKEHLEALRDRLRVDMLK